MKRTVTDICQFFKVNGKRKLFFNENVNFGINFVKTINRS